jgi:hypothetical protein
VTYTEAVEDADRADHRVSHDGDVSHPLDTSRPRARRNTVHDDAGTQIDDGDVRLGVGGHVRVRNSAAQRKWRRCGGEEKAAPVHTFSTVAMPLRVRQW